MKSYFPLSNGACGKVYKVQAINLEEKTKRRFEILGLTHNSSVAVLGKKKKGSMIIKIRGTRFAIGAPFAAGIEVFEEDADEAKSKEPKGGDNK